MNKMLFGYNFGKLSVAIIPASQAKADKEDWMEIDPTTLSPEAAKAYGKYKDLYRQAKDYREQFERIMKDAAGIEDTKPTAKASGKALSMADLIAMNGRGR